MFKKLRRKLYSIFYALPFGLKAGDELMAAPSSDNSEGAGIHEIKQTKSVWADLLEGRLTKEAEAMRYTMFLAEEKSNEYKYEGGGRATKIKKNGYNNKRFKMDNIDLEYSGDESIDLINSNKQDATLMPVRKIVHLGLKNEVTKFKIEKYINSIRVKLDQEPMTIELMIEHDVTNRLLRPLLNYIKAFKEKLDNAQNNDIKERLTKNEDLCSNIKDIDFITYGCTNNVPNGIHYYLTDIKFNGIEIKDNYVILSYNVGKYDDGKLLSEKFYSKEQQERYDKKEMKENGAALIDIASAAKTLAERDGQEKDDKPRHIRRRRNEELLS